MQSFIRFVTSPNRKCILAYGSFSAEHVSCEGGPIWAFMLDHCFLGSNVLSTLLENKFYLLPSVPVNHWHFIINYFFQYYKNKFRDGENVLGLMAASSIK